MNRKPKTGLTGHMEITRWAYLLFALSLLSIGTNSAVIRLDTPVLQGSTSFEQHVIFQNNQYNTSFIYDSQTFNCSQCTLFTYQQSPQSLIDNSPCYLKLENFTFYPLIEIDTFYSFFEPKIDDEACDIALRQATPTNPQSCQLTIINNCPSPVGLFNYFDTIEVKI